MKQGTGKKYNATCDIPGILITKQYFQFACLYSANYLIQLSFGYLFIDLYLFHKLTGIIIGI